MSFLPKVNQELLIDGNAYRLAEHPAAPGLPYGQEGRQAVVYQLIAGAERRALKVFKPRFQVPALVFQAEQLRAYASLPGLVVCSRTVLTPQAQTTLLRRYPELTYAVLMPWIEGPTWMQVLLQKRELRPATCLALASQFASVLAGLEQHGLAHCDLSGPNVLLPALDQGEGAALVDVEQIYGPELRRPPLLPGGSPGYAHKVAPEGLWSAEGDRFAGAVLLAEMLGWCDEQIRGAAWGESYFDPSEMQRQTERYGLLAGVLRETWGEGVASLLERAWHSDTPRECANFGLWLSVLPDTVPELAAAKALGAEDETLAPPAVKALLDLGQRFERQGKVDSAVEAYRRALALAPPGSEIGRQLGRMVARLQETPVEAPAEAAWPADTELAKLLDAGLAALDEGRRSEARELLGEVVRRQPDYERGGERGATLLEAAGEDSTAHNPWLLPLWAWAAIVFGILALLGAAVLMRTGPMSTSSGPAPNATTPRPSPTVTQVPTATTLVAVPAPSATPRPSLTVTQVPTATTLVAVPAPSATPRPSPTVTQVPMATVEAAKPTLEPAPDLISPDDWADLSGTAVHLAWTWHRAPTENTYFDVRIWRNGEERRGIDWTQNTTYAVKGYPSGRYYWSILVLRYTGTQPDGTKTWTAVSEESQVRTFYYSAPAPTKAEPTGAPAPPKAEPTVAPIATPEK